MAYRHDPDLEFLGSCTSEELNELVALLTYDKDGEKRYTEGLTTKNSYKRHYPNHSKYWQDIAEEVQLFGAIHLLIFSVADAGCYIKKYFVMFVTN